MKSEASEKNIGYYISTALGFNVYDYIFINPRLSK